MAVSTGEPILSRIDRLDYLLKQLEEIRGGAGRDAQYHQMSSEPSTPSSATDGGGGGGGAFSGSDFSPRSLEKHCRPINSVVMEAESKGTLIDRLDHIEDRLLKMEEELQGERQKERMMEKDEKALIRNNDLKKNNNKKKKKGGFKQMVKKLVKGGGGGGQPTTSHPSAS